MEGRNLSSTSTKEKTAKAIYDEMRRKIELPKLTRVRFTQKRDTRKAEPLAATPKVALLSGGEQTTSGDSCLSISTFSNGNNGLVVQPTFCGAFHRLIPSLNRLKH